LRLWCHTHTETHTHIHYLWMSSPTREASNLQEPFEAPSSLQNLQNQSHRQKSCNFESMTSAHAVVKQILLHLGINIGIKGLLLLPQVPT
jgi:hypothetical protein